MNRQSRDVTAAVAVVCVDAAADDDGDDGVSLKSVALLPLDEYMRMVPTLLISLRYIPNNDGSVALRPSVVDVCFVALPNNAPIQRGEIHCVRCDASLKWCYV